MALTLMPNKQPIAKEKKNVTFAFTPQVYDFNTRE